MVLLEGFLIPGNLPATGDLVPRKACSAYSLKSTSSDMALFCEELMKDNKIDSYQMFPEVVRIDETNSWSLGIAMEKEAGDKITLWHSGINPGFQSLYVLDPAEERFIVVLTNSDDGLAFSQEVARDFLGIDGVWEIKR